MAEEENVLAELDGIRRAGLDALSSVQDEAGLQAWRTTHLGRSSPVMLVFTRLGQISKEMRPAVGQKANQVKQALEAALEERGEFVRTASLRQKLDTERLDITLPGRRNPLGRIHPASQALAEIVHIFEEMGFQEYRSPEVETEEFNFELLNIPEHHPARDMWDTFHTTVPGTVLRTHTSPGQIHAMREMCPRPIRVILPGMVYRYEQTNASHEAQFNQVELLAVGKNITMGDMKGTIEGFARRMFGEHVRVRMRPSYFPFTEPSGDIVMECFVCGSKGCPVCKYSGWLEIAGCGMVHPIVLQNGGYDPTIYSGFAAGLGPERIALLKYQVNDIRYFFQNDIRFLEQF
ncbi:MAG: phenylalanine--tRNA ligase subunit alpha [Bellilinea sp.]